MISLFRLPVLLKVKLTTYKNLQIQISRHVLLLSTLHTDATIADNQKKTPETVNCYIETKYGVDIVNQMACKHIVRTITRRWPVHSFQNTLDLAAINCTKKSIM